jgi:hypothetical protein
MTRRDENIKKVKMFIILHNKYRNLENIIHKGICYKQKMIRRIKKERREMKGVISNRAKNKKRAIKAQEK